MDKEDYTKDIKNILNSGLKDSDIEFLKEEIEAYLLKIKKPAPDICLELASLISTHVIKTIDQEYP